MRGEFIDLDGARLYYYAAGSRGVGEPVVFLHGFATSGHLWRDVVPLMPPGHRLVVLDLLGYGRSDPPGTHSLSLESHAERLVALLDTLGISRACLVGHGLGGGVAQWLAVHQPQRVSSLGLVASIAFDRWTTRDVRIARATLPITRHLPPTWLLSMVRAEMERGYADATRADHAIERYSRPFSSESGRDALVQHIAALSTHETRGLGVRLGALTIPVSVLWGENDPFLPVTFGRRLADAIPGATLDVVPGARHFLPEEAPRQVADLLTTLVAR